MEHGAEIPSDDDDEEGGRDKNGPRLNESYRVQPKAYNEEQEKLREAFVNAIKADDDDDGDDVFGGAVRRDVPREEEEEGGAELTLNKKSKKKGNKVAKAEEEKLSNVSYIDVLVLTVVWMHVPSVCSIHPTQTVL